MQPIEDFTRVLTVLLDEVGGEWILVGGGLVRLEFDENRSTHDLDIAFLNHSELSETAALQKLYEKILPFGLEPDHVNSAMRTFLDYVPSWRDEIVPIRFGSLGKMFRPTLTLFTYLKLNRGSEIDLLDIKAAFEKIGSEFDSVKLDTWIANGPKAEQKLKTWSDFRSVLKLP